MANEVRYRLTLDAKDFTSGIKVATKEFEGFVSQLGSGAGSLGKVASAMGPVGVAAAAAMGVATAGVGAFAKATIDAAVAAVDFAGKISDLSTKTGIGGEALQKLGFAGSLVGTSMESMSQAVAKMQQHMVKAPEDFKQLGISLDKIKNLAPEKQFQEIGKAIQSIEDPAQRTAATLAIMGKGGQEAMKALSVDMEEAGRQAERLGIIMGDSTRKALDSLGDSVTVLKTTWDHLLMNFGGAIAEMPEVKQAVDAITEALGEMSRFVLANKSDIQALVKVAIVPMADAVVDLLHGIQFLISGLVTLKNLVSGGWLEKMAKALLPKGSGSSGVGEGSGVTAHGYLVQPKDAKPPGWVDPAIIKKQQEELARARKEQEKEEQTHLAFLEKIRHDTAMKELKADEDFWKKQVQMADDYGKKLLEKILKEQADAAKAKEGHAFIAQYALQQEAAQLDKSAAKWQTYGDVIATVANQMGGVLGPAVAGVGAIFDALSFHQQQAAENLRVNSDKAMTSAQKWQAAAVAAAGAIEIYQSAKAGASAKKGAISGAAKGAAIGTSIMPGYGTAIGAVAGGIIGFFGGKSGQKKELAELNAQIKQLQEQARQAGQTLNVAFNPKNAQSMKQAIEDMNRALGLQTAATGALHDAMDRYGITVGQLGPEFAKQELDQKAAALLQDYQLLTAAGVDHNAVIAAMGPNMQEYVNMSLQAGTSIPEAMRPVIQAMIDQGLLLDQNGQAYTSVEQAGLSFSQTMTEQFGTLISKINELVSALLGIPNVSRTVTVTTRHEDDNGNVDGGGDNGGRTPLAGGFEGMVNRPRTFLVGEAGPEYMSVRKPGEAGVAGFNVGELQSELQGMRADLKVFTRELPRSIRDQHALGRG